MIENMDPTLARQLRRNKLTVETPPNEAEWKKLLKYLDSHYKHVNDDRNMLARSLELSTEEMMTIRESVSIERDHLKRTMGTLESAIHEFAEACSSTRNSGGEDTTALTGARKRFNLAIVSLLSEVNEKSPENRALVNSLRTSFIKLFEEVMSMVNPDTAMTDEIVKLHGALIPPTFDEESDGIRVAAICEQLNGIGGDLWMWKRLSTGEELICLGDATGHGATAGFFSAVIASALNSWVYAHDRVELEKLAIHLNDLAVRLGKGAMFMTFCAIIIDRDRRVATVLNAGQTFPLVIRDGDAKSLIVQGNPLGAFGEQKIKPGRLKLESGDKVILFTDGVTETRNDLGNEYGERRLRRFLGSNSGQSVPDLIHATWNDIHTFRSNFAILDDATIVAISIR